MTIPDLKAALRAEVKAAVDRLTAEQRLAAAAAAGARLKTRAIWQRARSVLFYAPRRDEVDVTPLMADAWAAGKVVALPRYVPGGDRYEAARIGDYSSDVRRGQFGILEPSAACPVCALKQLDLVLVPGVCFDANGRRLGRGKGFYDRLLGSVGGIRCGVAFDVQVRTVIPAEPHDVVLDCLLTPTRWICPNRRAV